MKLQPILILAVDTTTPTMNRLYALVALVVLACTAAASPIEQRDISLVSKCSQDCIVDSELTRLVRKK